MGVYGGECVMGTDKSMWRTARDEDRWEGIGESA